MPFHLVQIPHIEDNSCVFRDTKPCTAPMAIDKTEHLRIETVGYDGYWSVDTDALDAFPITAAHCNDMVARSKNRLYSFHPEIVFKRQGIDIKTMGSGDHGF